MVPRVAARENRHPSHAEIRIADNEHVGGPGESDRHITSGAGPQDRANPLAPRSDHLPAAGHSQRLPTDRGCLGQMLPHRFKRHSRKIHRRKPRHMPRMRDVHAPRH